MTADDARDRAIRAGCVGGVPLPDRLRGGLERAFGADLAAVRLHDGDAADSLAASLDADAFTTGADVFFRAGALRPDSDDGAELLAHEVAHVVQQASRHRALGTPSAEGEATALARAFVTGQLPDGARNRRARSAADDEVLVLQRHSSWEHRMLGDLRTLDFGTIAAGGANRKAFLQRVQQYLQMWATNPTAVGADQITKDFHELRPLTLRGSGLVVTYGELNTLADYLATPAELDAMPKDYLLPILQQVRQEGYAWVSWVLEEKWLDKEVVFGGFEGSVANTLGSDSADALWETVQMESHTQAFGPRGIDHYNGLLARNACHFAPHSWYRWEQFYLQARDFAEEAHHATEDDRKARLTNLAWIHHGYADHFLHDSFAAGHLVNKTLIMQWYLDWVAKTSTPVPDWDLVQFMTVARQPDLAGRALYSAFTKPEARGDTRDPQTASEHWSLARRMAVAGVRTDGSTVGASYKRWLAFLGCGVVQLASNKVHDQFNSSSLWVSSEAHPQAFQIYGDNTMIQGGEGYQIASATAQISQQSLIELLSTGATAIGAPDIAKRFPTKVHDPANLSSPQALDDWLYRFKDEAGGIFDGFKNRAVGTFRKRLSPVNIDNTGGWRWAAVPGEATDIAVGGDRSIWSVGRRGSDGNGLVQHWDAATSSWAKHTGAGVAIAADGNGIVWVVNADGYSYRKARDSQTWETGQRPKVGTVEGMLDIAAGTDGSVWGLAKATVSGGHQVMRCVPGDGTHTWELVSGGATAISVGPDGRPWVVNDTGVVMHLTPGTGTDRWNGKGTLWTDVSPPGQKAIDIGLGVGTLLCAWITTASSVFAWNGRAQNQPQSGARRQLDWENVGGEEAVRIATGPDGRPWVATKSNTVSRLVAAGVATAEFATGDAGKVRGTALATGGSLFQGEAVSINGSTDLSSVIVGNSGARVYGISLDRSIIPGVFYTLSIDGQGPSGWNSGSMYIYIEDEGGFTEYKQFWSSDHHTLTIDYNGTKAGIKRISWSDDSDPARH